MATQESKNTGRSREAQETEEETADPVTESSNTASAQGTSAQTGGVDDLLDEIDGVLEVNAEEFVRGFVQKGGQ